MFQQGELAQLVERSLCMRKVTDSISVFSTITFCSRHQFTNTTVAVGAPVVDWILTKRCALILNYHRPYIFELFLVSRQWHSNIPTKSEWLVQTVTKWIDQSCARVYTCTYQLDSTVWHIIFRVVRTNTIPILTWLKQNFIWILGKYA
jgi:hypothetical protein